jgi:hypothetical protein
MTSAELSRRLVYQERIWTVFLLVEARARIEKNSGDGIAEDSTPSVTEFDTYDALT